MAVEPPECVAVLWVVGGVVETVSECGVVVGLVVVVGIEVQDSETDWTGPVTGSLIEESGVPGATLTLKLSLWPPARVTVTTHVSAQAVGTATIAPTPSVEANDVTATTSFPVLNTAAYLLPPAIVRSIKVVMGHDSIEISAPVEALTCGGAYEVRDGVAETICTTFRHEYEHDGENRGEPPALDFEAASIH